MIERYAGLRYSMDIAALVIGGVAVLVWLTVVLYEAWKNK